MRPPCPIVCPKECLAPGPGEQTWSSSAQRRSQNAFPCSRLCVSQQQQSRTLLPPWHSDDERQGRTGLCSDLRAEPQNSCGPSLRLPGCLGRTGQQSQPFQWDRMVGEIHRSPGNKNNNHNKNTKPEITYTHTNTQARTLSPSGFASLTHR